MAFELLLITITKLNYREYQLAVKEIAPETNGFEIRETEFRGDPFEMTDWQPASAGAGEPIARQMDTAKAHEIGYNLFLSAFLYPARFLKHITELWDRNITVRIGLDLDESLECLPWELLSYREKGTEEAEKPVFLGTRCSIFRYRRMPYALQHVPVGPLLLLDSRHSNHRLEFPALNREAHWLTKQYNLKIGDIRSWLASRKRKTGYPLAILLMCDSAFPPESQYGHHFLVHDDPGPQLHARTAEEVLPITADQAKLRLCVLGSPCSAPRDKESDLSPVDHFLQSSDFVLGMRERPTAHTISELHKFLIEEVCKLNDQPVSVSLQNPAKPFIDVVITEFREALRKAEHNGVSPQWWLPILYAGTTELTLFDPGRIRFRDALLDGLEHFASRFKDLSLGSNW